MLPGRTDLADEARDFFCRRNKNPSQLQGLCLHEETQHHCRITHVEVRGEEAARAIGKAVGRYATIALPENAQHLRFAEAVHCIGETLSSLLPEDVHKGCTLVVGLGNRDITPDALGPRCAEQILVSRHLKAAGSAQFSALGSVCALSPGVLGATGLESAELICAAAERIQPRCVIVVDALVSHRAERLCRTVQCADAGLSPGSGVGNHRRAVDRKTLGIPVLSVGVPTVIEAASLAAQLLGEREEDPSPSAAEQGLIVTPGDIDAQISFLSKLVAWGINLSLHPGLSMEDLEAFLG